MARAELSTGRRGKKETLLPGQTAVHQSYKNALYRKKEHVYEWVAENFQTLGTKDRIEDVRSRWKDAKDLDSKLDVLSHIGVDVEDEDHVKLAEDVLKHHTAAFDEIDRALGIVEVKMPTEAEERRILEILKKYSHNPFGD